jgi:hypothetical protein
MRYKAELPPPLFNPNTFSQNLQQKYQFFLIQISKSAVNMGKGSCMCGAVTYEFTGKRLSTTKTPLCSISGTTELSDPNFV